MILIRLQMPHYNSRQNNLADHISTQKPFFNVDKILLDAYTQEASAGGSRYPKARTDFFNAFEKGALIFNYLGHGAKMDWQAKEFGKNQTGKI